MIRAPLRLSFGGRRLFNRDRLRAGCGTKERANGEHKLRPKPARQSPTLPMRGVWKRSHGQATKAPPDERGGKPICSTYSHRVTLLLYVRREKAALSSGCKPHPANAPAGSNRSSHGGDEMAEAFGVAGHI